ncbi:MAG: hypothetical protein LAP21_20805 [Acidobacteriia bacterium]|nr:hypothetical protein [Terriglobia bacterium]
MSVSRSRSDNILGLAWVLYGAVALFNSLYLVIHLRVSERLGTLLDFIRLLPFWVFLALFIVGGVGIAFGRRWAWIMTLVLSLLYSAFYAFAVRGYVNIWALHRPPIGEVIRYLLPITAVWVLTIWTAVRFFSRPKPWRSSATT